MQNTRVSFITVTLTLTLAAACGDEVATPLQLVAIDHEDVDKNLAANLESTIPDGEAMTEMIEGSKLYNDTLREFLKSCENEEICEPVEGTEEIVCVEEEICEEFDLPKLDVGELVDALKESVFNEQNIETVEDTNVTYLLDPEFFCDDEEERSEDELPEGEEDEPCEPLDTPIRISVTSFGSGNLDMEVLVGEDRINPIDLQLHNTSITALVDLAAVKAVIETFS